MRNDHDSPHAALIATATAVGAKMASPYDATLRPEDVREARTPQVEDLPEIRLGEEGEAADLVLGDALGAGAMGVVHKAWQTALERDVAIKRLTEGRESEQGRRELLLEARLTGMLDHPNVVPVHALARTGAGEPLMIMKRVEGVTWRTLMRDPDHALWADRRGDRLERHLEILVQVCRAVEYAHSRGIVHLDIKPDNIMVGRFGEAWLMDWGLAIFLVDRARMAEEHPVGTPAYLAPEQLEGRRHTDERTDVFLLGAALHEVLAGEPRHHAEVVEAVIFNAWECPPKVYAPEIPAELGDLCNRACAREPDARFQSARALREAIEEAMSHREAVGLCATALDQLEALRPDLEAATADPSNTARNERVAGLAAASRFAFERSRLAWPDGPQARGGLQELLEGLIRFELARRNVDAVGPLLSALPVPAPDLVAATEALRAELGGELDARRELATLRRESTFGSGGDWRRTIGFAVNGVVWFALMSAWGLAATQDPIWADATMQAWVAAGVAVVNIAVVVGLRGLFFDTRIRRAFTAAYCVFMGGLVLNRACAAALDLGIEAIFTADALVLTSFIGALAAFAVPALWWAAAVTVGAAVVGAVVPEWMFWLAAADLLVVNAIFGWALRPKEAGGQIA